MTLQSQVAGNFAHQSNGLTLTKKILSTMALCTGIANKSCIISTVGIFIQDLQF